MSHPSTNPIDAASDARWLDQLLFIALGAAVVLIASYAWTFHNLPIDENPGAWGTFGDFMGGLLNPLISLFTLLVAIKVLHLQRQELKMTREELKNANELMTQQYESMEGARLDALFDSCRQDINGSFSSISTCMGRQEISPFFAVETLSRNLEITAPLVGLNSHAVSFSVNAPGYETPLPIEPWNWSIAYGNDAREKLRLMLPMCRTLGETLKTISTMPERYRGKYFSRLRNTLGEWPLSTFTYFLVLHPDRKEYQTYASQGHALVNLNIQRARAFAIAYLPPETYRL